MNQGILRTDVSGVTVDLSRLTWMQTHEVREEIREFFLRHGYAEAEKLPYNCQQGCLIVNFPTKEAIAGGWHEAVDSNGIPF